MPEPYRPPTCACGHPHGVHTVKGDGLDKRRGRCNTGLAPKGKACDCTHYVPEATP